MSGAALAGEDPRQYPKRLEKDYPRKIARVVFFRALDGVHNFAPRSFNNTRATYFVLSAVAAGNKPMSALQTAYLAAMNEAKQTPAQFNLRENLVSLWQSTLEEIPKWRASELRAFKKFSRDMVASVKLAQKALALLGENDDDMEVEEEAEAEGEVEEEEAAVTETEHLPRAERIMFTWAMEHVQKAIGDDTVGLEQKMQMLSLLQGGKQAGGGEGARGQGEDDEDEEMADG